MNENFNRFNNLINEFAKTPPTDDNIKIFKLLQEKIIYVTNFDHKNVESWIKLLIKNAIDASEIYSTHQNYYNELINTISRIISKFSFVEKIFFFAQIWLTTKKHFSNKLDFTTQMPFVFI